MNARITDRKVFESLRPLDVLAYLRSSGWTLLGYFADSATVWNRDGHQVLLPQDGSLADFARRMAEILDTLAEVEQRSQLEIVRDLATATSDVVRLRVVSPVSEDGSVGLEEGVALVESAKDLILSAARAAVSPRAFFRSRLPGLADDYMRSVRLGQTELGSYVVTVVCPVSPELRPAVPASLQNVDEPYDRRVTRTLAGALQRSVTAAREAALKQDMEPFTSAVREGVSANLCAALVKIGEGMEEGHIEVSFAWARSRTKPQVVSSRIVVAHESIPVMREAARVLRATYSDDDFELNGPVVRLESPNAAGGGNVVVFAEVDTMRKVLFHLEGPNYEEAVRAHQEGLEISCRGKLEKQGRYFTLRDVRDFAVQVEGT
jgi:hypothetical protein